MLRTSFRVNQHSTFCLNFKELLARSRRHVLSLSDSNVVRTHNHLVRKRILNHLVKLGKWLSVHLRTKWLWVRATLPCLISLINNIFYKELRELHNDYPLALKNTEIKSEILSKYQLLILIIFLEILLKKLLPNFLDKDVFHYQSLKPFLRLSLQANKNSSWIKTESFTMAKTICQT